MGAEEHGVGCLREHHEIRRLGPACVHDRIAKVPRDDAAVGEPETLLSLTVHIARKP